MAPGQPTVLTRQELYTKVWSEPGLKVAQELGLSDVGLAKICKRNCIPRPPRGYWAKLQHGHQVRQAPLPTATAGVSDEICISSAYLSHFAGEAAPNPNDIQVNDKLTHPHRLVEKTREYLRGQKPGCDRIVHTDSKTVLAVSVAPLSISRALRIFDALIKAWIHLGGAVEVDLNHFDQRGVTAVSLGPDSVTVRCFEETDRFERDQSKQKWNWGRWEWRPNGKLVLEIDNGIPGLRGRWADRKKKKLEAMLGEFVQGLQQQLAATRLQRIDDEIRGKQRRLLEDRQKAKKLKLDEEQANRVALQEAASRWHDAYRIRDYLEALEKKIEEGILTPKDTDGFPQWLAWAHWYADSLDPLGFPAPLQGEQPVSKTVPVTDLELTRSTCQIVTKLGCKDTAELAGLTRKQVDEAVGGYGWTAWDELCDVLEGLGFDVTRGSYWSR